MNILILHGIEDVNRLPKSVVDLEFSLPKYSKGNYIFHCYKHPFYPALTDLQYDGIIIWSTFLDARHHHETYAKVRQDFEFVAMSSAVKIALPQDEYYCNELLDNWLVDWNVDYVYTVLYDYKDRLLPLYSKSKGTIRYGFTGYIDKYLLKKQSSLKPFNNRSIDVSYRASGIPTNLNQLASFKAHIGDHFIERFSESDLNLDISVRPQDFISGSKWFEFIEDSRFVLGVNSGSSIRIPDLEISGKIRTFSENNPSIKYEDLVKMFLEPEHQGYFTAISPRNIEAALLGSCQITTSLGSYSDLLHPGQNYISIEPDCSNYLEVTKQMNDKSLVQRMIENCRESILSCKILRLDYLYDEIMESIGSGKNTRDQVSVYFLRVKVQHGLFIRKFLLSQKWKDWKTYSPIAKGIKKTIGYKSVMA